MALSNDPEIRKRQIAAMAWESQQATERELVLDAGRLEPVDKYNVIFVDPKTKKMTYHMMQGVTKKNTQEAYMRASDPGFLAEMGLPPDTEVTVSPSLDKRKKKLGYY